MILLRYRQYKGEKCTMGSRTTKNFFKKEEVINSMSISKLQMDYNLIKIKFVLIKTLYFKKRQNFSYFFNKRASSPS